MSDHYIVYFLRCIFSERIFWRFHGFFSILPAEEAVLWTRINVTRVGCGFLVLFFFGFCFFFKSFSCHFVSLFPLHWSPAWLRFLGATMIKIQQLVS